jgi:nickel-dependent lactate racemase
MAAWRLKYGEGTVSFTAPEETSVAQLAPAPFTPLLDPPQAVRDALDAPAGSPRLRDLAAGARRVLIVVPDLSQPAGLPVVLHQVLDVLQDSGVGLRQVDILVARGMHSRLEADQAEQLIGPEVWNRVVVRQHDPAERGELTDLGESERGTPLMLNRHTMESGQLLLLVGAISPDGVTGFTGGPALLLPGLAARESALANRRLVLAEEGGGFHQDCRPGELEGNPVYEDAVEATEKVDPDFLVHTVIDEEGRMVRVVAGEWRRAFENGCNWLRGKLRVAVNESRMWAVASAGGASHDRDLVQASPALESAAACVRDGGHLVFVAECREGLGDAELETWVARGSAEAITAALRKDYQPAGHVALALRLQAERIVVHLVSSLPAEQVKRVGLTPHASLVDAWAAVAAAFPEGTAGFVVPAPAKAILGSTSHRESPVV